MFVETREKKSDVPKSYKLEDIKKFVRRFTEKEEEDLHSTRGQEEEIRE